MKFVTLALAFFLAVGCQAASLQADAPKPLPTYLEHARGAMKMYLNQLQAIAKNVANRLEDEPLKAKIITNVDDIYAKITALQEQVAPLTDGAVSTIDEATMDLRTSIHNDIAELKRELEPMSEKLKAAIIAHLNEYKTVMKPIEDEYFTKEKMAAFKTSLEPVMAELQTKIAVNVEDTKSKLMPMVDMIRNKIQAQIESMRQMAEPYVEEYREQIKQATAQAQTFNVEDVKTKLEPHMTALKSNLDNIFNEVRGMMGQ